MESSSVHGAEVCRFSENLIHKNSKEEADAKFTNGRNAAGQRTRITAGNFGRDFDPAALRKSTSNKKWDRDAVDPDALHQ